MHLLTLFVTVFAFLGLVTAVPNPGHDNDGHHRRKCLTDKEASDISAAFENFYVKFDIKVAESLLADEFQSFSDSNGNFYPTFTVRSTFQN
jgi:hypothetical protein